MSKGPVHYYLSSIYQIKGSIGLRPIPTHVQIPHFVCATPESEIEFAFLNLGYNPWSRCESPSPAEAPSQAFYADGTAYIFICPSFFSQVFAPGSSQYRCPQVVGNKYSGDVNAFYRSYQMYTMLYQLIRFYLGVLALNQSSIPKEAFDWNQVIHYAARESVMNPTNMLIYSARE